MHQDIEPTTPEQKYELGRRETSSESEEESDEPSLEDIALRIKEEFRGQDSDPEFDQLITRKEKKKDRNQDYDQIETKDPYEVDPIPKQFKFEEECLPQHKKQEEYQKKKDKERMENLLKRIQQFYEGINKKYPDYKEILRFQMANLRRKIAENDEQIMTPERFNPFTDDQDDQGFDYGTRELLKNEIYEKRLATPFKKMDLFV